ncbi:MAG: hypothetical protein M3Y67_00890 [Pseudomonadota bacterium]|nr:hypothetical protein [Pseudomonadota bacterium]
MKTALAPLLLWLALPCAAQVAGAPVQSPAPAATPTGSARSGEPEVRHTVIEGEATTIDELRVRGVTQRIVVTTKGRGGGSRYEIITGDGSRDLSDGANTSRGAAGKRVWRVLNF